MSARDKFVGAGAIFACLLIAAFLPRAAGAEEKAEGGTESPTPKAENCLECHAEEGMTYERDGKEVSITVKPEVFRKSVHGALACADCHEGLDPESVPHRPEHKPVDCTACHEDLASTHKFHPQFGKDPLPQGDATSCAKCHGTHEMVAVSEAAFRFAGTGQVQACGACHALPADHFAHSAHGKALMEGRPEAPACLSCHDGVVTRSEGASNGNLAAVKAAQVAKCEACHVERTDVATSTLRGSKFVAAFEEGVHGKALRSGKGEAANCVDCHGAHEMNKSFMADTPVNKRQQPATCATCHEKEAEAFNKSVHAVALQKGHPAAPTCSDCHGEHEIRAHADPTSPVNARNLARQVCATCHDSLKLTEKYGIATHTFKTFADSYHGLAVRGGAVEVVNCASCHDSHNILSQHDPASPVHKSNLAQTCGECHPGANTRFAVGSVHVSPTSDGDGRGGTAEPVLYWVATVYVWMIVVVVGGMFIHNLLDFLKKLRRKLAIQKGLLEPEHVPHRLHLRMTLHERLQHGTLVLSFAALVLTGFMLSYPEAWWVEAIRNLSPGTFEMRSLVHRIAAVVMVGAGFWHIGYLAFSPAGRSLFVDLWPRWRDVTDPWKVLRYNLGLSKEKPRFPRFSYIEKAEYWALAWGTLIMTGTGIILWFDNTSMGLLSKLGFDIARTVHFFEAVLATLAIIVWHFYFVIFNPDVYPMNLAWLTGRMSEEELLEEHPLQLEEIIKRETEDSGRGDGV